MSRREKAIVLIVLFVFVLGVAYMAIEGWRSMRETAELSCMASILSATGRARDSGRIVLKERSRELTRDEVATIISEFGVGDCGNHQYLFDEVHIAIGDVNTISKADIRVWMDGPDGVSRTSDDLVIPWEENSNVGEQIFR